MTNTLIKVRVNIPPNNYIINSKADGRRMTVYGWDLTESENLVGTKGWIDGWIENCQVLDAEGALPETLYIVVLCALAWCEEKKRTEGHSWYAQKAFVSRERAEEYVTKRDNSRDFWGWVVPVKRVS